MGQKLAPNELALYRATDEVLHYIWDPIGVAGSAYARDEYHGYLPTVYSLLVAGDEEGIRNYLLEVSTNNMGLELSPFLLERAEQAVALLLESKQKCDEGTDL